MMQQICASCVVGRVVGAASVAIRRPLHYYQRNQRLRRRLSAVPASSSLAAALPHLAVSTNPYDLESHGKGESYHPTARPFAVVTPKDVNEVVDVVRYCNEHKVPLIPYGAGTSCEGHLSAISSKGSISLDMTKLDSIELSDDPLATVGAGVTRMRLNQELRHSGLHFVVDPGADATLGGMVACGASGTTAVQYGTMRENILGLTCVLPDGTVAHCGGKALKSSAGYDLTSLMTGSEGTLGVITSVTVKLHPLPAHVVAGICIFEDLHSAAEAVAALKYCSIPLARCELLDATSIKAFNRYNKQMRSSEMQEKPTLFLEFQGPSEAAVQEQVAMTESICTSPDYGGSNFSYTSGEEERKALWSARHSLLYASIALRPGATHALITDACVPLSKFSDLISATAQSVEEQDVVGPCFGHAGDGNFHCILPMADSDSDDYIRRLHHVNDTLIQGALAAGGTCTGEHGVGYGKIKYLEQQYGSGAVEMMKLLKRAFDPNNIMNPGKVVAVSDDDGVPP